MRATVDAPTLFSSHEGSPRRLTVLHGSDRETGTIAVAIADGQRLVRAGVRALLEREHGIAVVGEAATGEQAIALTRRTRPDVVLMDVSVPGLDCVEATRRILAELGVAVMVLTPRDGDHRLFAALGAGAVGPLFKDTDPAELVRAVRVLGRGGHLRPRDRRRKQRLLEEDRMLTPKVIEIRRGSAHPATVRLPKPVPGPRKPTQGGQSWNSAT
jgi:DNA-binding NarL/FixJ family response regulator